MGPCLIRPSIPLWLVQEFVTALQTVVSREVNPLEPAVLSITSFQSGTTSNVIPGEAHLSGTARTFNKELREAYPPYLGTGSSRRRDCNPGCHPH